MAILPTYIPEAGTAAVASYNYSDIAEGTGLTTFYPVVIVSGATYALTNQNLYSTVIDQQFKLAAGSTSTDILVADYDFDLSVFNFPKTIGGSAIIQYPQEAQGSAGQTMISKVDWYIRKWDGTTETTIAQSSGAYSTSTSATPKKEIKLSIITIPNTHFKKGDVLRLTGNFYANCTVIGGAEFVAFAYDPKNRDGTYIKPSTDTPGTTTTISFYCPFRLDV